MNGGRSIRGRLTALLGLGLAAMAAVTLGLTGLVGTRGMEHGLDSAIRLKLETLMGFVEQDEENLEVEFDLENSRLFQRGEDADFFQIRLAPEEGGTVLAYSASLPEGSDFSDLNPEPGRFVQGNRVLPTGQRVRVVATRFVPRANRSYQLRWEGDRDAPPLSEVIFVYARSREEVDRAQGVLVTSLVASFVLIVAGGVALVWWGTNRGLRPLEDLATQARRLDVEDGSARFRVDSPSEELVTIGQRLNELVERLRDALEREKRFSNNVAHELRTPLAELMVLVDVTLEGEPDEEEDRTALRECGEVAGQMNVLVNALLDLARAQSGRYEPCIEEVDICALATECWKPFAPLGAERGLRIRMDHPGRRVLSTDPVLLGAILTNLLRNAVVYTMPGGMLTCRIHEGEGPFLVLSNDQQRLHDEDLSRLDEPFWRKTGREDPPIEGGSHGLGLALVRAYAKLLGMVVEFSLQEGEVFEVRLRFREEAPPPAAAHRASGLFRRLPQFVDER